VSDEPTNMIDALRQLVAEEQQFPVEAYCFLYQALDRAQRLAGERRHVSGQELLEGARLLAIELFGPLTLMVFDHWNLRRGEDFGTMVFHLVDRDLMGKTDDDKLEDFAGTYEFREAFAPENLMALVDAQELAPAPTLRPARKQLGARAGAKS
jgi:uncharacterized repeat protein (TIGR04138 family)